MGTIFDNDNTFLNVLRTNEQIRDMKIREGLLKNSEDFYHVCMNFADIGLNAIKCCVPGTCDIQGMLNPKDINNAKESAKQFYLEKHISDINEYLLAIELLYALAVDSDDSRRRGGVIVQNTECTSGFFGKYLSFTSLSDDDWQGIKEETKKYILETQ